MEKKSGYKSCLVTGKLPPVEKEQCKVTNGAYAHLVKFSNQIYFLKMLSLLWVMHFNIKEIFNLLFDSFFYLADQKYRYHK